MRYGVDYVKKTEQEYAEQQRDRQEKNLHRRAREMGYKLEKINPPPANEPAQEASEAEAK